MGMSCDQVLDMMRDSEAYSAATAFRLSAALILHIYGRRRLQIHSARIAAASPAQAARSSLALLASSAISSSESQLETAKGLLKLTAITQTDINFQRVSGISAFETDRTY